jgi:phospholipase A1
MSSYSIKPGRGLFPSMRVGWLAGLSIFSYSVLISNAALAANEDQNACLLEAMESASPDTTLAQLRAGCAGFIVEEEVPSSVLDRAIFAERQSLERDYALTPHKRNYLLPFTHNDNPNQLEDIIDLGDDAFDHAEAEFQVSMKFPVVQGVFDDNTDLLVAYTGHSWWQVYNDASAPFRETNYQPEIFLRHYGGPNILGAQVAFWDFGVVHESNGRSDVISKVSRSWNRIYGNVGFDVGDFAFGVKAWYRIPEDEEDDNNPNIYEYRGYAEFRAVWAPNKNTFSAMYRPGTQEDGLELSWSYPINNHLRFFTKYYKGYGESMIDYDHEVERIGIGIAINDFVQN